MKTKNKGVLTVMISAIIFGSMPLMSSITHEQGCNSISLVFYRFFLVLPVFYFLVKKNKNETLKLTKEELKKIVLISTLGYSATALLLFISYNYIPSGMATTIHFIYPVFVILGTVIFCKEKTTPIKVVSVTLCVLGVLAFYDGNAKVNLTGILLSFLSGITFAFYCIYFDQSGLKKMNIFKFTFYLLLISSVFVFIFSIATKSFVINIQPLGWLVAFILSLSVGLGGTVLYQVAIKAIGPQSTAILSTFEPITSILLGIFILNESFGIRTILGIVLILLAVILITIFE